MSNCVAFHTQIASIMEVLANAAVAEICKLVDDGYAVLRLEMSQSQKENKALKRKLQMLELRIARGCTERNSVNSRPLGVQCFEKTRRTVTGPSATQRRDGEIMVVDEDHAPTQAVVERDECADVEEEMTESLLIKEERSEEDRDPQRAMNSREERAVEWRAGSREKRPVEETQNKAANHTEELTEQHRTRRAVWECTDMEEGGTEALLIKEEGPEESLRRRNPRTGRRNAEGGAFPTGRASGAVERGGAVGGRVPALNKQTAPERPLEDLTEHSAPSSLWECADMEEGRAESLLIKEEKLEEDRDPQREMNSRQERLVDSGSDGLGQAPPLMHRETRPCVWEAADGEKRSLASLHIKEEKPEEVLGNTENHREEENSGDRLEVSGSVTCTRTRHSVWESGESETPNQRAQHRNPESLASEPIAHERPGQLGTLLPQMTSDPQTGDPSCSFSAETGMESLQVHSEPQSVPVAAEGPGDKLSALSSLEWDSELEQMDFVPAEEQAGIFAAWSEGAVSERVLTQHRLYSQVQDKEETQPRAQFGKHLAVSKNHSMQERIRRSVKQFSYPKFENSFGSFKDNEFQQGTLTEEGLFNCMQCGKSFAKLRDLKGHQRVHTGEKPFACSQCEKCFSYHHQLKMHQRIHTGEKPFVCTQCGKRFTQSSHIKTHQAVHTGERPFSCSQCGKSFSIIGNLLRHQNVHTRT